MTVMDNMTKAPSVKSGRIQVSSPKTFFNTGFRSLTGFIPYPWQYRLFQALIQGKPPGRIDIPSACGKSAVPTIWVLAASYDGLMATGHVPRHFVLFRNTFNGTDRETENAIAIAKILTTENLALAANTSLTPVLTGLSVSLRQQGTPPLIIREIFPYTIPKHFDRFQESPSITLLDMPDWMESGHAEYQPTPSSHLDHVLQNQASCSALLYFPSGHFIQRSENNNERSHINPILTLDEDDLSSCHIRRRAATPRTIIEESCSRDHLFKHIIQHALSFQDSRKTILICLNDTDIADKITRHLSSIIGKSRVKMISSNQRNHERSEILGNTYFQSLFMHRSAFITETHYLICVDQRHQIGDFDVDAGIFEHISDTGQNWRLARINRSGRRIEGKVVFLRCPPHQTPADGASLTTLVWRERIPPDRDMDKWLGYFPIRHEECLRIPVIQAVTFLRTRRHTMSGRGITVVGHQGNLHGIHEIAELIRTPALLRDHVVILPSDAGGLDGGLLSTASESRAEDLADVDNIRERWTLYRRGRHWHARRVQSHFPHQTLPLGDSSQQQAMRALENKTGLQMVHQLPCIPSALHLAGSVNLAFDTWLVHPRITPNPELPSCLHTTSTY
ncbi:hypothetical protein CKO35_09715 [Ectothiorhodospira shaposhnikovii]|nr:hypothetical protein [Ectothiorhodospira shaposhnikovii]